MGWNFLQLQMIVPNLLSMLFALVLISQSFERLSIIIVTYLAFTTGIHGYSDSS